MQREVIGILGKTGYGKSVWLRRFLKNRNRLFVFDPLADTDVDYLNMEQLLEHYDEGLFNGNKSFRVGTVLSDDLSIIGALSFAVGNNLLAIEECAIAFENPRHSMEPWLNELIFMGRHRSVSMIFVAQRGVSIPISVRSQFTRLISFSQHEGTDLNWLRDYFGNAVYDLPQLPPLHCIDSSNGKIFRYSINYENPKQKSLEFENTDKDDVLLDSTFLHKYTELD